MLCIKLIKLLLALELKNLFCQSFLIPGKKCFNYAPFVFTQSLRCFNIFDANPTFKNLSINLPCVSFDANLATFDRINNNILKWSTPMALNADQNYYAASFNPAAIWAEVPWL